MAEQTGEHDYIDQPGGRAPRCARCGVVTFDARWEFVVTWDPAVGQLPYPVARLFRSRSTLDKERGRAAHRTDRGHSAHYVKAVNDYLAKHAPDRQGDVIASATEMGCDLTSRPAQPTPPSPPTSGAPEQASSSDQAKS